MRQAAIILLILTLIAGLAYVALTNQRIYQQLAANIAQPGTAVTQPQLPTRTLVTSRDTVAAGCKLIPNNQAGLSFSNAGLLAEVLVKEGEQVQAGQVLARQGNSLKIQADIISAERTLSQAKKALDDLNQEAFLETARALKALRDAEVAVKDANKALKDLQKEDVGEEKIAQAEANLAYAHAKEAAAERDYEILKNGPDPKEIAELEERIKDAEAQIAARREAQAALELHAPFAGTVMQIDLQAGEYASPGARVLLLVDQSRWLVETTDLTEYNVVRVQPGNSGTVTFDAMPNDKFAVQVLQVIPIGEDQDGEIRYPVQLVGDLNDPRLLWNMSCAVVIKVK
jgi:multidrug resistance efflux pump